MGNYSLGEVARITGVSCARLRHWERTALLAPRVASGSGAGAARDQRHEFGFRDLVSVRSLLTLLDGGVSLRRIRHSVDTVRERMPEVDRPLAAMRTWVDGSRRLVLVHEGVLMEPGGQLVLDFGVSENVLPVALRAREPEGPDHERAVEWFEQGCKLDSNRATFAEAIEAYERAIECDPGLADAHCNLGSVYFNQDRPARARDCFLAALARDPGHVEANLNLATLLEEEGRNQLALRHYRVALNGDPMCADTHVSLALLYEKLGLRRKARSHWRSYVQLEPNGTWIDIARQRLSE